MADPFKGATPESFRNTQFGSSPAVGKQRSVIPQNPFEDAHRSSDVDTEAGAQHHTLGLGNNQAFPGNLGKGLLSRMDGIQSFRVRAAGPLATAAPPNATTGTKFTLAKRSLLWLMISGTGFTASGATGIYMYIYLAGLLYDQTYLAPVVPTNQRMAFPTTTLVIPNAAAGDHWVYLRMTVGSSNADDAYEISGFAIPWE